VLWRFTYHNHAVEFRTENGVLAYDQLLRLADPAKLTMEHVKDFKLAGAATEFEPPPSTEMERGSIDYRPIFQAAKKGGIEHAFVEQEQFDMPAIDALKIDADYMRAFTI